MENGSFVLYDSYGEQIESLTNEQAGALIKAIYAYRRADEIPELDAVTSMAFSFICMQFDEDDKRREKLREKRRLAGALGGAPKGNKNARKQPKQANGCFGQKNTIKNNQNKQMVVFSKNAGNIRDCDCLETITKQANQPKQANGCFGCSKKEKDVNKEKLTKEKNEEKDKNNISLSALVREEKPEETLNAQARFFSAFPSVVVDNYSSAVLGRLQESDWELLLEKFRASAWLRKNVKTTSRLSNMLDSILAGSYDPFENVDENVPVDEEAERQRRREWFDSRYENLN